MKSRRYFKPFKSYCRFFFRPPAWISGGRIFGDGTIESPYQKMGVGVDTGIVILAGRWAKLEGGAKLHPRCSRYKIGPLFAG